MALTQFASQAPAEELGYVHIWLALLRLRDGKKEWPLKLRGETAWPAPIYHFLADQIDAAQLLKLSDAELADKRLRRAEAHYFIGQKQLLAGEISLARNQFEQVLKTGAFPYWEYYLAQQELSKAGSP